MDARDNDCPVCGNQSLDMNLRMQLRDPQPAFAPVLYCRTADCAFERWGWFEDGQAVFIVPEAADL